jgi:hypothetical protein
VDRVSPLVALVSDFGLRDSYVAEMKLAIARRVPGTRVLDVSHDVPPFDRLAAALVIDRVIDELPRGSALAAVIDPGVGTSRRRIYARRKGVWMVGPDNGVLPLGSEPEVWSLRAGFLAPRPSVSTFDGREVFAPLAALLASGLSAALAGERLADFVAPILPSDAAFIDRDGTRRASGIVVALDRYGNAITNIRPMLGARLEIESPSRFGGPVRRAYGEVAAGAPLALVGSSGRLELAVREGRSGLDPGDAVVVRQR